MHLTLYIQPCRVIGTIMEIDNRGLSYHNPTYITAGNCYFGRIQAKEMGGTERAGRQGCLPAGDQMLSGCIDGATQGETQVASVGRKTFLITGQIVAVITGAQG